MRPRNRPPGSSVRLTQGCKKSKPGLHLLPCELEHWTVIVLNNHLQKLEIFGAGLCVRHQIKSPNLEYKLMIFQDEIDGHNFSSSETLQVITYMNYETKLLVSVNVKYCSLAVYPVLLCTTRGLSFRRRTRLIENSANLSLWKVKKKRILRQLFIF